MSAIETYVYGPTFREAYLKILGYYWLPVWKADGYDYKKGDGVGWSSRVDSGKGPFLFSAYRPAPTCGRHDFPNMGMEWGNPTYADFISGWMYYLEHGD